MANKLSDKHDVIGFTLSRTEENQGSYSAICASCEDLRLANGIHIGMQKGEFTRVLGGGVESVEGFYQKGFKNMKPMTNVERRKISKLLSSPVETGLIWDIVVFVRGAFSHGVLDILQVSRTLTF